jgi:signal peptidase II
MTERIFSKRLLNSVFILSAAVILAADQVTKYMVSIKPETFFPLTIIPRFLFITSITNTGAAFGMFQNKTNILIAISIVAIILIVILKIKMDIRSFFYNLALGFILGGALGNLADRFLYGKVTDFIHVAYFAVFNVADSFIVIGFGIIILIIIRSLIRKEFIFSDRQ